MPFALNPSLDPARIAVEFDACGRVLIPNILAEASAFALHRHLCDRADWKQVMNSSDTLFELDRATRAKLSGQKQRDIDEVVYGAARYSFQYRYESLRVPDDEFERAQSGDLLARFATWWSSGEPRAFLRQVTGAQDIAYADAQATAYSPGDFLTSHHDYVEGKERIAAYVLNLCPDWRIEWGGLLLFPQNGGGERAEAYVPGFNRLSLLRVPQMHCVSEVSRAAADRRYSITGWLRR